MRLCYIANPNSIHTQRWIRWFVKQGHEVHLIGEHAVQQPIPVECAFYNLPAQFDVRRLRYIVWGLAVRRIVRQIRPELLHAHQVASAGWLGAAAGYHPFLVTAWGSDLLLGPRRSWAHRALARWVLGRADYVTCVSDSLARAAQSLGADPTRLEVVPWGVDTDIFHPAPAGATQDTTDRSRLGLGKGPVVLSTRAIRPVYNPLDIAHAIPLFLEQVHEAQFVIRTYAYDADLLAHFQRTIEEHRAAHAVHYVGPLPGDRAIADLYRLADVAISVPSSDGTPISVLEALACGLPVVLSDVPSLREWVQDGREGLFAPVGDVQAISANIVRMLIDDSLRQTLSENGARLVRQRADREFWMCHSEEIYERLIEGRPA